MTKIKVNVSKRDLPPISCPILPSELAWPLDPRLISWLSNETLAKRHSAFGSDDLVTWTKQHVSYKAIYHCGFL